MNKTGTVFLILITCFVSNRSETADFSFSLQSHAQDANFRQVVFRVDDEEYRRTIDTREKFNSISQDIFVDDNGKDFLFVLSVAWIEVGTNTYPQKFTGSISFGAYSSKTETPATSIGQRSWKIDFAPGKTGPNIAPFAFSKSKLDKDRTLYFCQFYLSMSVHPALPRSGIPEDICIWLSAGNELFHYKDTARDWRPGASRQKSGPSFPALAKESSDKEPRNSESYGPSGKDLSGVSQSGTVYSNIMPTLGIVLKNGYVLVNSSPTTTNGTLEQADIGSYPLVWQPVVECSNTLAGWQLPLKPGAKIFRLKASNSQP